MNNFLAGFRLTIAFWVVASAFSATAGAQTSAPAVNAGAAPLAKFTVQRLNNIAGGVSAFVYGVNDAGEAVGAAGEGTSSCPLNCAVIWHDAAPTMLGADDAYGSEATAINNSGQVVGGAYSIDGTGAGITTAFIWENGTSMPLSGPTPKYTNTFASSINDRGQVAGSAGVSGDLGLKAIEWNGLSPIVLGEEADCTGDTYATSLNNEGVAAGVTECPENVQATVWHSTTPTLLGTVGSIGKTSSINDSDLVVGLGAYGATAWVDGIVRHLGTNSTALAVNNRGIIVGKMKGDRRPYHAALWSSVSAAPQDLNKLIGTAAGKYVITEATAINYDCTIAANGSVVNGARNVALLLRPIDPSDCAKGF